MIDVPSLKKQADGTYGFETKILSEEERKEIAESDSVFIPIILDKKKQVYMVHMQAK